jgi:hypothetical protein
VSQPWGYTRLRDPGLRGALARWWLRRRMARVSKALDRLRS